MTSTEQDQRALVERLLAERGLIRTTNRIRPRDAAGSMPLSYAQQGLWLTEQLEPGNHAYVVRCLLRLDGDLNPDLLRRAAERVVRRHESLRTVIRQVEGLPTQVVLPDLPPVFEVDDGTKYADPAREAMARLSGDGQVPFDLCDGPLLRLRLVRTGEREWLFGITTHHIVCDGWSLRVLLAELTTYYEDRAPALPELEIQYGDYALWERGRQDGTQFDGLLEYWRAKLAGAPQMVRLPTDRPRPTRPSYRGSAVSFDIPAATARQVRELARGHGATPFMVLLAAFAAVLARYADTDDVVLGSPVANRSRRELEPLIGPFVNTLLLRIVVDDATSFAELLESVRETATDAYEHQEMPFERLVELLLPERDISVNPLFQVMFAYADEESDPPARLFGAVAEPVEIEDDDTAKFDLTLLCRDDGAGLIGRFEFSADLFDRDTVDRLAGHYRTLLIAATAAPGTRLADLPLMDHDELRQVLHRWNDTGAPYPDDRCLHHLFEEQVDRTPDRVALVGEQSVTFAALNARANQLAHHLIGLGAGTDALVGICLDRSVEMIVALLAVFKAGAAYVPLDPNYPPERLRYILSDTAAGLLVTRSERLSGLPVRDDVRLILLDRDARAISQHATTDPVRVGSPDDLAYVTYTSGSTGRPKGVLGSQRGMVNCVWWLMQQTPFETDEVMAQRASLNFLDVVWEVFTPLLSGVPLVIFPNDVVLDIERFVDAMDAARVSRLVVVPSLLRELLNGADLARRLSDVRYVYTSGEALSVDLARRFDAALPHARLVNLYGTSEISADVAHYTIPPGMLPSTVPIGRALSNMRLYILDGGGHPVPAGVPGELYVGGIGLARGYLGLPAETADRFVPDPFGDVPGARLYRTGDLVRLRPDGDLEYLGRGDGQIKIRGFRIEPGEIEALFAQHRAVYQSVVVAREAPSGGRALVAFVVPRDGDLDVDELRGYLRGTLPGYMVPARIVVLDRLPMTPSGKILRSALSTEVGEHVGAGTKILPATPTERTLARIWAEVLELPVDRLGRDDDFFDLGGHSLLATRVINQLRRAFESGVSLRLLFERSTIRDLAEALDLAAAPSSEAALVRADRTGDLPLSFSQQRLWFFEQLQPAVRAYNVAAAFRIEGPLDPEIAQAAIRALVARHEVLRTRFPAERGVPMQVIEADLASAVTVDDLTGLPPAERELAVLRILDEQSAAEFDLATGPLLRVRLVCLGDASSVLAVTMHHIVCDAWSLPIFAREFLALADAMAHGRPSPLPELAVQYADYALWHRRLLSEAPLDRQLTYWHDHLRGAPPVLRLPTDRPRPGQQTFAGDSVTVRPPTDLAQAVRDLCRQNNVTLYMVMLAAFDTVLAARAGMADVVVGTPIANRTRPETESLIGFFINTIVLRTRLDGDPSFAEILQRVRRTALDAYQHQDLPFEQLVRSLRPPRGGGHTPIFQVMFNVLNQTKDQVEVGDLRLTPIPTDEKIARYDLSFIVWEVEDDLECQLVYNIDLFDRATADGIIADHLRILEKVCADPGTRLPELTAMISGAR